MDDGFTTSEGYWLPKRLLMDDARSFGDVLEYVREWDHATMTGNAIRSADPNLLPPRVFLEGNELSPFCTVERQGDRHRSVAVKPTQAALAALAGELVTDDDRLSWKIIEHADRGRALVILEHGHIIGSRWLAYIDPATIPARPLSDS